MPLALKTLIVETYSDNILQDYHNSKYAVAPFPRAYVTSTWEPPIEPTKPVTMSYSPIQFQWPENHIYFHPTVGQKIYTNVPKIKPTESAVAPTELETTTLPLNIQFQWPENHIYFQPTVGQKIYTNDPKIKPTESAVAPTELETTTLPLMESQSVAFSVEDVGSRTFTQSNSRSFQISYEIVIFFLCFTI